MITKANSIKLLLLYFVTYILETSVSNINGATVSTNIKSNLHFYIWMQKQTINLPES